jgi:hypothetical protein
MWKIREFNLLRYLMLSSVVVVMLLGIYGGCGSSGGGGNNPPPTNPPPTNPPPTNPPPTQPPPTNPPTQCQAPPLNTNFSDTAFFFIDAVNAILVGLTSTGTDVVMTLSDIPDSGAIIGLFGGNVTTNTCLIDTAVILDVLFPATGQCVRSNNGSTFAVLNFQSLGVQLVDVIGQCDTVAPLGVTAQRSLEEELVDASISIAIELSELGVLRGSELEQSNILDFTLDLEERSEE